MWRGNTGGVYVEGRHRKSICGGETRGVHVEGRHRGSTCGGETQGEYMWRGDTGGVHVEGRHRGSTCGGETQGEYMWRGDTGGVQGHVEGRLTYIHNIPLQMPTFFSSKNCGIRLSEPRENR